jgi:hypothetical protein
VNCKPNELAVIVGGDNKRELALIGRVVRLTRLDPDWHEPSWFYSGARIWSHGCELISITDRHLRPIRPGDISDEEVRDLYAPKFPEVA